MESEATLDQGIEEQAKCHDYSSSPPLAPSNTEDPDPAVAALYAAKPKAYPQPGDYRERSANIWADPKLRELKHFTKSHSHLDRVKETVAGASCSEMDRALQTRVDWRHAMDRHLNRLMVDMELTQDKGLKQYAPKQRCQHLDKIYQWYERHGMKEARKERAGPAYLAFDATGPIMAGSLRVAQLQSERPPPSSSVKSSSSAPSLLVNTGMTAVNFGTLHSGAPSRLGTAADASTASSRRNSKSDRTVSGRMR